MPHLVVDPPSVRFSPGMPGLPARSLLRVRNQGIGTLQGSVSSDAPWLVVETTQFTLSAHSAVTIGLRLEAERLNGSIGYAQVALHTNAGDRLIPVRVEGRPISR